MKSARAHFNANSQLLRAINEKLRREFKDSPLFPPEGLRVIEAPLACVPDVSANPEYTAALREPNRKIAAMDMESGGFLAGAEGHDVQTLCVRAISDFADEGKRDLEVRFSDENRRLAIACAIEALEVVLASKSNQPISYDPLALTDVDGLLFVATADEGSDDEQARQYDLHESFFSLLVLGEDGEPLDRPIQHFVQQMNVPDPYQPVFLVGDKGVGKTTFLSHLHRQLASSGERAPFQSFFLRLKMVETWDKGEIALEESKAKLKSACDQIVHAARNCDVPTFVIIDGFNRTGAHRLGLIEQAVNAFRKVGSIRIALSVETQLDVELLAAQAAVNPQSVAYIRPMSIEDERLGQLVERFSEIVGLAMSEKIVDDMRQKNVAFVDMFVLAMFFKRFQKATYKHYRFLSQCYAMLCQQELADYRQSADMVTNRTLSEVAKTAYDILISRAMNFEEIRSQDIARLLSHHASVTHFLVAWYVIDVLTMTAGPKRERAAANRQLGYVFPAEVNSFAKQIIASDPQVEGRVVEFITRNFPRLGTLAKSHCAYLAGRVSGGRSVQMLTFLKSNYQAIFAGGKLPAGDASDEEIRDRRMLRRSMLISRSILGDTSAESEYVDILLEDPDESEFNRGFHLEYYGDTEFDPSSKMSSRDDKCVPCDRTVVRLLDRIVSAKAGQLPLIEFVTLLSLVQVRNREGRLRRAHRRIVLDLLESERVRERPSLPPKVRGYLGRMKEDLSTADFNLASVLQDWISLAGLERSGWLRRRGDASEEFAEFWTGKRLESVAEHKLMAMGLAETFLQENGGSPEGYSKRRVIEMLLVHDLAEGRLGDQLPGSTDPQAEQEVLWEYGAFATYRGFGNMWRIPELFREFTADESVDAQVAQDFDRLQFLLQARTYAGGMSDRERRGCEATLGKIRTETVRAIEQLLRAHPSSPRFAPPEPLR
jgi:5'-deoxynucleotidase YfbR-like HD superfamily hydrolase